MGCWNCTLTRLHLSNGCEDGVSFHLGLKALIRTESPWITCVWIPGLLAVSTSDHLGAMISDSRLAMKETSPTHYSHLPLGYSLSLSLSSSLSLFLSLSLSPLALICHLLSIHPSKNMSLPSIWEESTHAFKKSLFSRWSHSVRALMAWQVSSIIYYYYHVGVLSTPSHPSPPLRCSALHMSECHFTAWAPH